MRVCPKCVPMRGSMSSGFQSPRNIDLHVHLARLAVQNNKPRAAGLDLTKLFSAGGKQWSEQKLLPSFRNHH